jgi:putative (di)nucleoside polyphosphate hydrolase
LSAAPAAAALAFGIGLVTLPDAERAFYRLAVGVMLLNRAGNVFVGRRIDMPAGLAAWQMPQGGIDPGETPRQAAIRELKEEIGTDNAEILGESRAWLHYELPPEIAGGMWGGRYRGQRQKWFAMRFTGEDTDIDPAATEHPEFDAWEWVLPELLPDLIVPFKRLLYLDVLAELREHWSPNQG